MNMKNKLAALTILTAFGFSNVNAASIDEELAVIAAEQAKDNPQEVNPPQTFNPVPEKKSRKELKAEEKRLREERKAEEKRRKEEKKAEEKRRKEEMKAAEKEVREAQKKSKDKDYKQLKNSERTSPKENFPKIDPVNTPVESVPVETAPPEKKDDVVTFDPTQTSTTPPQTSTTPPQTSTTPPTTSTTPPQTSTTPPTTSTTPPTTSTTPIIPPATLTPPEQNLPTVTNLPNPIVMQANFEELTSVVHFVPLYIPKKSGFSINSMMSINNRIAEIRYGRRWEPEVSLRIRTYKRMDGEETKDISGVSGVKWRVDMTSGTTVYIAKIAENRHVAAWAVGKYTFSAYVENLSFAAFHAIVADELVDLSRHYYID